MLTKISEKLSHKLQNISFFKVFAKIKILFLDLFLVQFCLLFKQHPSLFTCINFRFVQTDFSVKVWLLLRMKEIIYSYKQESLEAIAFFIALLFT